MPDRREGITQPSSLRTDADRYAAYAGDNTPPYLYAIANDYTDPPSALAFLADVEVERVERLAEMWAEARAMGIA